MKSMILSAPAKVNLSLDITGKLPNGYHTLDMIMQTISLSDEIRIEKTSRGIDLSCDSPKLPLGEENICYKAAAVFLRETTLSEGVRIKIQKRIPIGAGLAGGSADAAAVLKGMNRLFNTRLTAQALAGMGLECGADVPFCLRGGTCRARGIGEILTTLPDFTGVDGVLIMPEFMVSTSWVYRNYRREDVSHHPSTEAMIEALRERNLHKVARSMGNVLESVTAVKHPEIEGIKRDLKRNGALGSVMSGSGPSVFGLFENGEKAAEAISALQRQYERIFKVLTINGGEEDGEAD